MSEDTLEKNVGMEEDYDDGDSEEESEDVQLGFIEEATNALFGDSDWRNWDGGKVGGNPVWLNPEDLPATTALLCSRCSDPLQFLLQIYCPIDELDNAFHRSIYLFCCKRKDCLKLGSIKALRSQLSRVNPYYTYDPANSTADLPVQKKAALCGLCGCRGSLVCSQCKSVSYCSKVHQKEHWKCHKLTCCKGAAAADSAQLRQVEALVRDKALFPEYGIEVEAEVFGEEDQQELKAIMEKANIWEDAVTEGGADEEADAKLTQADYQKALGSEVHDPTYINFLTRVDRGGRDQVLRYCRTANPFIPTDTAVEETGGAAGSSSSGIRSSRGLLLLSSDAELLRQRAETLQAHPCERCGAPRTFECQVMPQLLHFLRVDQHTRFNTAGGALASQAAAEAEAAREANGGADPSVSEAEKEKGPGTDMVEKPFLNSSDKDIDWGSLDIFTCSASCAGQAAYVEELVLVQPPVYGEH